VTPWSCGAVPLSLSSRPGQPGSAQTAPWAPARRAVGEPGWSS